VVETLNVGGLERVVIDLVKEQASRKHQCLIICLFEEGKLAVEIKKKGISLDVCSKQSGFDFSAVKKLADNIKSFNPDVIHSHNIVCNYYAAFAKIMAFSKASLINTRHGIGRGQAEVKEHILFGISVFSTRWIVGVCNVTRDKLQKEYPYFRRKILTIYNGIVLERFKKRTVSDKQRVMRQLGIQGNAVLLSIVARLNDVKNHKLLLQAFAQTQNTNCYLIIIGDGELMENLRHYADELNIQKKVFFLGDRKDVSELLPGMDLFILCSKQEGYSISLLEACASGLTVIATDVGGNGEIVTNANGILIPSEDVSALSQSISLLISDDKKRQLMGENSLKWIAEKGSIEVMANNYEALYVA